MKKTLAQLLTPQIKFHNSKKKNEQVMLRIPFFLCSSFALALAIFLSFHLVPAVSAQDVSEDVRIVQDFGIDELDIQNPADLAFSQYAAVSHVLESYELTTPEQLISVKNHSTFDLENPQSMVFAPSGDPTDDPAIMNLYLVDASPAISILEPDNKFQTTESALMDQDAGRLSGRIIEFSMVPYPQLAATVPTDSVTLVKTTETSNFNTPNDPTDDSIEYWPDDPFLGPGTDSFTYKICDPTPQCATATVTITVNAVILATVTDTFPFSPLNATAFNYPTAGPDNAIVNEGSWVNIDVLANDDFGTDGPAVGPIEIVTSPTYGTARVNDGPRSPDPSGLTYLRNHPTADYTNKLLISDGEVDEIVLPNLAAYTGVNLFITTLAGSLDSTLTTYNPPDVTFSQEPTGVTYNPTNDHLFFTDDNAKKIFELNPGDDGLYNTADDIVTSFDTGSLSPKSEDPEGVAFDGTRGHLLVVDGLGAEVYDIDLVDGTLNGNETVTHFDVSIMGIRDPEGIELNKDNGHLYIMSSKGVDALIAETTIDGTLLRYLDISAASPVNPAGLAYAPASDGSGGKNLYIVDRGVDNATDPNENDGRMYEVSIPNTPPAVGAGPNQIISLPNNANLVGTVADDGLPDPPGEVTTVWSVEGIPPGTVTFGDDNALLTTASFSTDGIYILRLTAFDGELSAFDEVTITVEPPGNEPPTVDAGPDQTITLPNSAILDGDVSDDGLPDPPGAVTTSWIKISGPGEVFFTDRYAVDTTAQFVNPGIYVLRLTAIDGGTSSAYDEVIITVNPTQVNITYIWLPIVISVKTNQ